MEDKNLQDYLIAIKKRSMSVFAIALTVIVISVSIAFLLPPVFKSSSTILIEQQEIPTDLVRSTITSYASERIQSIQARVMTRTNLFKIIDKYKLYEDELKVETKEEISNRMREDVALNFITAKVVDPRSGSPTTATIAFSLSYKSDSRAKAQRVASELTTLYLDENLSSRTQEAAATSAFLQEENNRLGGRIDKLENKLSIFKQKHSDTLPERKAINISILQRKETELNNVNLRLSTVEEKISSLQAQLTQTDPGNTTTDKRLEQLLTVYASIKSKYSSEHPDVLHTKDEIESLQEITSKAKNSDVLAERLSVLKQELANKNKRYTSSHPDVVSLTNRVNELEKELNNVSKSTEDQYYDSNPTNPVYLSLETQLNDFKTTLKVAKEERKQVLEKIGVLELALNEVPEVEREYLTLRRDYANAVNQYNQTKNKQMQADIALQLESESKGERFTLIEPATLPEKPISPNRPIIVTLGFFLAIVCGIGFAIVADLISGTIRGASNIASFVGAMPLSVIPFEMNLQERIKNKKIKKRIILLFIMVILFAVLFIHFMISPLDVLWFRILRKIDVLTA